VVGRTDLEDALRKLDKLTQEEARMATVETLKATHIVDERVRGVADQVVGVNDEVRAVDDKVTGAVKDAQVLKRQSSPSFIGLSFESHMSF
jgi:hypothetical protein